MACHQLLASVAVLLGLVAAAPVVAQDARPSQPVEPVATHRFGLAAEIGPELLWNPFELSPKSLSKLRRDRSADRESGRFDDVESESDAALRAALEGTWRFDPGPGRALRVWAGADFRQLLRSPRGSYVALTSGAKHELGEAMFVRLDLDGVPARFEANRLAGADDTNLDGSIDDAERRYRGLWSASGAARATFGWRFGDEKPYDWAEVFVGGGAERHRRPFQHRDGTAVEAGLAATFRGGKGASTRIGYRFGGFLARPDGEFLLLDENDYEVDLNGDGDLVDKNVGVTRDVDYSHLDHEFEARWRWEGKRSVGGGLDVGLRVRQWTSGETFDRRHEDRIDLRLRLAFHLAFRLWEAGVLEIGARGEVESRTRGGGAVDAGTELDHASGRVFARLAMEF